MKFYGITGVANKLMESYLRNRYQRVIIDAHNNSNGYYSKWKKSTARSPTGFSTWTVIVSNIYILMIFPEVYLTNPAQFYLQMT